MQNRFRNMFFTSLVLGVMYTCSILLSSPKYSFTIAKGESHTHGNTTANISQSVHKKNESTKVNSTAKLTSKPTSKINVVTSTTPSNKPTTERTEDSGLCPKIPPGLKGAINPNMEIIDWDTQHKKHTELTAGGFWRPTSCRARHKVAIFVPFRKRDEHLHVFTNTMHDFLQKQQVEYGIYIIEQAGDAPFNRALLFNIGYKEAMKDQQWDCLVFHDVDNIPMNDKNLYHCSERPRHLSVAVQRMGYRLPYTGYFGGVSMMSTNNFEKINGMSNKYWGWGGEDDDLYARCRGKKLTPVLRYPVDIGRYKTITQHHVQGPRNPQRGALLSQWAGRQATDGLSDVKYNIIKKEYRKLFTYLLADVSLMEGKKKP